MLKIKLARFGKRNQPHFRVVINEARDKRDGSYVEKIGHYAPTQTPKILEINKTRYDYWISQGAQPTDTVAALFEKSQSKNPFPAKKPKLSKKARAKLENGQVEKKEEVAPKAEKPAQETKEAPAAVTPTVEEKPQEKEAKPEVVKNEAAAEKDASEKPAEAKKE